MLLVTTPGPFGATYGVLRRSYADWFPAFFIYWFLSGYFLREFQVTWLSFDGVAFAEGTAVQVLTLC